MAGYISTDTAPEVLTPDLVAIANASGEQLGGLIEQYLRSIREDLLKSYDGLWRWLDDETDTVLQWFDSDANAWTNTGFSITTDGIVSIGGITLPGIADTQVAYSDATVLSGDSTHTFNKATKIVTMNGLILGGTTAIGLDMSGGTFATAIQKWPAGTIQSTGDIAYQPTADSTTAYQWLDQAGTGILWNVDTTNGRIGKGTASLLADLHIEGTDPEVRVSKDVSNYFTFTMSAQNRLRIDSVSSSIGRVGIGKDPAYDLDVNGAINASTIYRLTNKAMLSIAGSDLQFGNLDNNFTNMRFSSGTTEKLRIMGSGRFGFGEVSPETFFELTNAAPHITLHNSTHEDTDGGRELIIYGKGEKSGGEEGTLAAMEMGHDGTGDDYLGYWKVSTNANGGADTLVDVFKIDGSQETFIGDAGTTDFSKFEADGTLEFNGAATVWDDYVTALGSNNWNGVSNNPTLTKLADDGAGSQGVYGFVFSDGDEAIITAQLPHKWKEGGMIYPHIHFMTTSDVSPTDNFGIEFEYWWADVNEDFPANTTLSTIDIETGVNSDTMHQAADIVDGGIDGTGHTISSVLMCRIKRVAADSDNYAGGIVIVDFDIHYEIDTVGSRAIWTKAA